MTTFSRIWSTQVKQLAEDCIAEPELIRILSQGDHYKPSQEEKKYLESISKKYKDIFGMFYISDMIWKVEHALANSKVEAAVLAISQVYSVLSSPTYFQNVFSSNENNEEWKKRVALRSGLNHLLYLHSHFENA